MTRKQLQVVVLQVPASLVLIAVGTGLAAAQAAPPGDVIATVNGRPLLRAKFVDRLEMTSGDKVLADLIARELLADAFEKSGLQVTAPEVDAAVAKIRAQAPDEGAWQQFLAQQSLTEPLLREFVTFQLKVQKLSQKDVNPTDEALKQDFAQNGALFGKPETVVLSEIVVTDRQKAVELRQRLHQPGVDFATLAREASLSPTKEQGGRRPEELASDVQPEGLAATVTALKVHEVGQPVQAENMWWILRLEQRTPAQKADYEQVKGQVRDHYVQTHAKPVNELIEGLRGGSQIKIADPRYQKLEAMFAPPPAGPPAGGQQ
jgi:parvulin-like peptidyl-prolyl isomerase